MSNNSTNNNSSTPPLTPRPNNNEKEHNVSHNKNAQAKRLAQKGFIDPKTGNFIKQNKVNNSNPTTSSIPTPNIIRLSRPQGGKRKTKKAKNKKRSLKRK